MSEPRRNALLATIPPQSDPATRAGDTFSSLFQETKRQQGAQLIYRLDRLEGSSEPFVAYRPENLIIRAFHDGVTPATFGSFSEGSHRSTYRWTFPDLGTPIAITVDNPDPDVGPAFDDIFVSTGQTEAVLELQCVVGTRPQGSGEVFTVVGQFLLNGQPVFDLDTTGGTVQRDASGAVTNQASLAIVPIFEHPASGSFHLSADKDGQSILDEAYIQRGLEWAQPWPNLENLPLAQPVEFSNQLQWDGGEPLNDNDGPRWRATVAGIDYPPDTPTGMPQYNYGSQVSFTFDPDEPQVTARASAAGSRTITLLPEDKSAEYPSVEAWRQARQAREDCPAVAYYSVEGQAVTYDAPPALYTTTETFTEKVAARVRKLLVTSTRLEPNPIQYDPGQAQPVVLRAEVASCLFVEPQIRWSLTVRGERLVDPEDPGQGVEGYDALVVPAQDWQDFTQDYTLEVPWNGQGPDGLPIPQGTYHAELLVEVREKNRVDRNGNVIMKSATGTADLEVQGGPRIDIADFTATPSSFPAHTGQTVTFDAHATVSGFAPDEPPTVRWTWRVKDPGGNVLFETSQEGAYQLSFHEATGLPPLAAGLYPTELVAVATNPYQPALNASSQSTIYLAVGQATVRHVTISNFLANPSPFDPVEGPVHFSAYVTTEGFGSAPQMNWVLEVYQGSKLAFHQEAGPVDVGPIVATWDGSTDSQFVASGAYQAKLSVEACEPALLASTESGRTECPEDTAEVALEVDFAPFLAVDFESRDLEPSSQTDATHPLSVSSTRVNVTLLRLPAGRQDAVVTLRLEQTANSGGHHHTNGNRPAGFFGNFGGVTEWPSSMRVGQTTSVTYIAPEVSGQTVLKCQVDGIPVPHIEYFNVGIPNLVLFRHIPIFDPETNLPTSDGFYLVGGAGDDNEPDPGQTTPPPDLTSHPSNHWATQDTINRLRIIAYEYRHTDGGESIWYNDISLQFGGLFDAEIVDWLPGAHFEHRHGNIVDMIRGNDRLERQIENWGGEISVEGDHWHVRF